MCNITVNYCELLIKFCCKDVFVDCFEHTKKRLITIAFAYNGPELSKLLNLCQYDRKRYFTIALFVCVLS